MARRVKKGPLFLVLLCGAAGAFALWSRRHREAAPAWPRGALVASEECLHQQFDLERLGAGFRHDPVAFLLPAVDQDLSWYWSEHPRSRLHVRTNNLGFRDDEPTLAEKRGLRVLVAGDSQVAGPMSNEETFPALLEWLLRAEPGRETLEVLDAGVAYTGPYCYLGVLRKYLSLAPDVFIAVLCTGNDFLDELLGWHCLVGEPVSWGDAEYARRSAEATERAPGPVHQGLSQAFRWKHFPADAEHALQLSIESFTRMRDLCAEHGIEFLALVLPTKADVEPEDDPEAIRAAREALGMNDEEAAINRALGLRFAQAMEAAGIRCLDLFEEMRNARHPLYWHADYHLGPRGHALVAKILARELAGRL